MNNNNNNNDIKTLELSSGCFESSCSNNKIINKLSEMQSQNDLDQNKTSENVTSLLSADMKNVKDGNPSVRENSLNNGDDASGQEMYDQNSWVLYGDVSAKNSWVLYGTSDTYLCNGPGEGLEMDQKENVKGDDCDVNVANHLAKDGDPACENLFNQSRPHACSVCCKRFKLSHHLKEHMRIHTGEKPFPCAVCGDRFSRSHLLRAHQARHAQESFPSVGTIFPCSKCMKIFESPQHLARHEKNHVLWKCESCGKQFTHLLLLKRHKQLKHSAAPDSELCSEKVIKQEATDPDESSSRKENPNEAVRDFHGVSNKAAGPSSSENKSLSKNKINSRVTLANEYISKPSVSSEPKMVYDQNSWVLYGEKSNAELPVSTVKEEPQTFNSGLDIAGSSSVYKGIDLAKLHELYLASNRSLFNRNGFLSPFYGLAGFNRHTLMSLMNHAAMNNMLPLSYPAGQSVKTESPLAEGSRPHQCPHCAKRFKLSHHLREHLRIHTGEKPYRCDLCQERFSRSHLLQRHKTKHISDFAFHRVTDWIQQNSADRTVNSYSDHFSPPQQPSTQTEIPNSLLNNQQTKSKITYLQNKNHEEVVKSTTSNLGPERALNQDDENQTKTGKLSNISNADVVQGVTTKDNSDVKISGKNSTNSIYGMSKVGHKPHSIAGCSRTFQTSTPSGNSENGDIGQTDHSLNSCHLENKISESRDDELKSNLRAYSDARHPGKDSSSDSSEDNWETSQQTKSKTVSNQSNTNHLLNLSGNDRIINKVRTRQLRKLADPKKRNKEIHENNREMIASKNIKSEGDVSEPTSETKPSSELPSANYPSHFQLNQSLLNNNINLINTGYFNYTQNLQQAIKIGAFRSFNNSNATGLEHPQEAFLSPLDYSNFFRTRPGGFMRCEFCGKWFSDMNNLRQHMVSHSLDRHFSCRQCEKKFKRPHHLKEHMRIHTGEKPYICDICDEKFSRSHILQRHRSKHDTQLLSDSYVQNVLHNICDQRARSPEFVYDKYCSQDLIKGDSGPAQPGPASSDSDSDNKPSVESEGMDTDATNRKSQSTELRSYLHDPNLMQAFACQECGKKFANSSNLKQHMVSHFPDRLFSCSVCSKKFKRPHHLKEHSRTHTGEKPFQCRRCGERFQRSHLLMKHKEKHHSCYSNSSTDPSSATTTFEASDAKVNGYLNDQTVDDTSKIQSQDGSQNPDTAADCDRGDQSGGEAVFCNICSKEFPSETALTVHRRTHPGDRPHQCGNCGKQFALQYLLEVHEKSCSSVSIASS